MSSDSQGHLLDIDVPAPPEALVQLSLLLAEDDVNLQDVASLIEGDMALASAVLRAVNASLYALKGGVQTVQQAITYLGVEEVSALTYETSLRSVFRHSAELEAVWQRAGLRGLVMGRLGQLLDVDPWSAHSAGLFEECGKAVLFRHAPDHYRSMLRAAQSDSELLTLEQAGIGIGHDVLGAALCERWGLAESAAASVRHHVQVQATLELPPGLPRPAMCVLSGIAHALMHASVSLEEVAHTLAPQGGLDETLVLRGARKVEEQLAQAALRRRTALNAGLARA